MNNLKNRKESNMTDKEAIKYLQQLYPNGGHCWLDEQRIEAIGMAIDALSHSEVTKISDQQEPVSNDFETALTEMVAKAQKCVVEPFVVAAQWKDYLIKLAKSEEPVSEDLEEAARKYADLRISNYETAFYAFLSGAKWKEEQINEALLSEVLPCFMHGGEADEVVAKLDEVLNQKK